MRATNAWFEFGDELRPSPPSWIVVAIISTFVLLVVSRFLFL